MVLRHRALARVGRDDGGRHQLGEADQRVARPGIEHPLPGPEHRVLRRRQHLGGLRERRRVGRRALGDDGLVVEFARQVLLPHLGRDLDQDGAALAGPHRLEGAAHQLGQLGNRVRPGRPLGDRRVDLGRVEGRVAVLPGQRLAGRQDQHRHVLGIGLGDAGEGVLDAGAGLGGEHPVAAAAVDPAVAVGEPDADPLLAAQDRADADLRAGLDQRVAGIARQELRPLAPQDLGDRLRAVHHVLPGQVDHVRVRRRGVEPVHLGGAAGEHRALVDVALVGDLAGVDGGRLGGQHGAGDAGGRAPVLRVVGGEAFGEALADLGPRDDVLERRVVGDVGAERAAAGQAREADDADLVAVVAGDRRVLEHRRGGGDHREAERADRDPGARQQLEVLRHAAVEDQPLRRVAGVEELHRVADPEVAVLVERLRG